MLFVQDNNLLFRVFKDYLDKMECGYLGVTRKKDLKGSIGKVFMVTMQSKVLNRLSMVQRLRKLIY